MAPKSRPPQYALYARLDAESEKLRCRLERRLRCKTSELIRMALQALNGRDAADDAEPAK